MVKQGVGTIVTVLMVDSSDHVTGKTGLSAGLTIYATKNGVSPAVITPTVVELDSTNVKGVYSLALNGSHTDTIGELQLHITASGADPTDVWFQISANLFDDIGGLIRTIWNSLKNQADFFSKFMDRLGLLERNQGLVKQDIQEAVTGIVFPPQNEFKMPPFPTIKDYSSNLSDILGLLKNLSIEFSSSKSVAVKINTGKMEDIVAALNLKIDALPKYDAHFSNVRELVQSKIDEVAKSVKADASASSAESRARGETLMAELKKLQNIFSRFDTLMSKLQDFSAMLNTLDSNGKNFDKSLKKSRDEIQAEINRLNMLVNTLAVIDRSPAMTQANIDLLRAFGGKK